MVKLLKHQGRKKILKNKDSILNRLNEEITDNTINPEDMEKTIASGNPAKYLNIEDLASDDQDTKNLAAEITDTGKQQVEDPDNLYQANGHPDTEDPSIEDLSAVDLEEEEPYNTGSGEAIPASKISKDSGQEKDSDISGIKDQKTKNEIDDRILVAKSQQGDKAAFEKLVRLYSKYVYTNAFFILRDSHDAEDVSQEVFVKVFLSIKNFRGLSSFKTWLRKLTINTCIDKLRIKSKTINKKISLETLEEGYEVVFTDLNHNIERDFFSRETVKEVLSIIVNLDESYRVPLILRDLQDYSYREISILIKKPIGTVKTNIHRARKIIKDKMKYEKEKKR
jgi:RNA polymerase sigma-70 factor, ECF subfamily